MSRKVGRPRLDPNDESVGVTVRLPSRQYDKAYELARRDRVTIGEVIRRAIARETRDDREK